MCRSMKMFLKSNLLILVVCLSAVQSKSEDKYYRAAVLEYVRFGNLSHTKENILSVNLKSYELAARTAAENNADIIVFPEWGLYPHKRQDRNWVKKFAEDIPDPKKDFTNPCSQEELFQDRPILKELSCIAHENKIYLVANMADAKQCSNRGSCDAEEIESCSINFIDCPQDEIMFHNTNVVFDRQGTLIAKYYKRHLYYEFDMNPPTNPEDIFFETDFGKFTTFVCFDLMFRESVEAIEKSGVINVAYPTYWFDNAPFFYLATPIQQAWAITNRVNLLAANSHNPGTGTLGSGIYSAEKGALVYTNNPDGRSKLLISNVPRYIDGKGELFTDFNVKRFFIEDDSTIEAEEEESSVKETKCLTYEKIIANTSEEYNCFHVDNSVYNFVKLENNEGPVDNCMYGFCCHLSYKATSLEDDYFLGAFSGNFILSNSFSYGMESCFLTRCDSSSDNNCADYNTKSKTIFQFVDITGNFIAKYVYPFAVNSDLRLTDKKQWIFNGKNQITYHNLDKMNSLNFLGLNGRHYNKDEVLIP